MSHQHHDHSKQQHPHSHKKPVHKDWRFLVAVGLMLAAMLVYVFTNEEGDVPGEPMQQRVPEGV
ncbi:MAG: hypothetical protein SGJ20_13105 [Planctomycetota bacterium]|nr:hypothetical protein [Planctomycetota bacterium]